MRDPRQLKQFYADTLTTVAPQVLNQTLFRFVFTVDRSLDDGQGGYLNPRIARLAQEQDAIFEKYHIRPEREVSIRLTRGGDDASSDLKFSVQDGWVSRVGLKSACSPRFLSYLEQTVRRHDRELAGAEKQSD